MKVIIAGTRDIFDIELVEYAVAASMFNIKLVVSGMAGGIDTCAVLWARRKKIPFEPKPADWYPARLQGRRDYAAGYKRNVEMADFVGPAPEGGLIAIWDGRSKGTGHMIDIASDRGLRVYVYTV